MQKKRGRPAREATAIVDVMRVTLDRELSGKVDAWVKAMGGEARAVAVRAMLRAAPCVPQKVAQ